MVAGSSWTTMLSLAELAPGGAFTDGGVGKGLKLALNGDDGAKVLVNRGAPNPSLLANQLMRRARLRVGTESGLATA